MSEQKSDREKAEQAWKERRYLMTIDVAHGHRLGTQDLQSSLKRDIEKRIEFLKLQKEKFPSGSYSSRIEECEFNLRLIETVEP